jgi:hypothetical protein
MMTGSESALLIIDVALDEMRAAGAEVIPAKV